SPTLRPANIVWCRRTSGWKSRVREVTSTSAGSMLPSSPFAKRFYWASRSGMPRNRPSGSTRGSTLVEHLRRSSTADVSSGPHRPSEGARNERRRTFHRICFNRPPLARVWACMARTIPALPHSAHNEDRRRGGVLQLWVTQDQFLGVCDQVVPRRV